MSEPATKTVHSGKPAVFFMQTVLAVPAIVLLSAAVCHAEDTMAVVILPPQATVSLDEKDMAAAELLCDQLAAKLAEDDKLRVVDRTQLDKVLKEGEAEKQPKPFLAYDVMLRVRIDLLHSQPVVILDVIDLSAGNIVGTSQWPWAAEMPSDRLQEMAKACGDAIHKFSLTGTKTASLRFLGVSAPAGMGRLEPLRLRLEEMLAKTAADCPTVRLIHHLEAASAKEESLLLLMGLARLGEGRQFTPQADAVLEVQIAELDSEGKTFEDTTIEIRIRFNKNGGGEWKRLEGKVADWAKIVPQACELLAGELGQAQPQAAAEQASEMMLRRAQAEAEFQAAMDHKDENGKPDINHIAAAAKLDPTYEPAAYWMVECCCWQEKNAQTIPLALQYLEMFPQSPKNRCRVTELAYYRIHGKVPNEQETDTLRRIVEIALHGSIDSCDPYCGWLVAPVYQGMKAAGVSPEYRLKWLDQVRQRVDIMTPEVIKAYESYRLNIYSSFLRVRYFLVDFAMDCGRNDLARQRLKEFMACRKSVARDSWGIAKMLRETVVKMKDEQLLAEYDRWLAELTTPVRQITLQWNDYAVYEKKPVPPLTAKTFPAMYPLTISPDAVYGVSGPESYWELFGRTDRLPSRHRLIFVPIDEKGRPCDKALPLPLPNLKADIAVTGATFMADRLYVSTKRTGLLVCDVDKGEWKQIGPDQGLADWYVFRIHPLDEKTLLIIVGESGKRIVYCTMDVKTEKITLLHRTDAPHAGMLTMSARCATPVSIWRSGETWTAMNYIGLARDILKNKPEYKPWPNIWPYGWQCRPNTFSSEPTSMAAVGDKRYVMDGAGLHEIDETEKVIRSWWNHKFFYAGGPDNSSIARDSITTPGEFPACDVRSEYQFVAAAGEYLFLMGSHTELLCYEPASDTWFGPLDLTDVGDNAYPLGSANGVWVGGRSGAVYVETKDFIKAAKDAGRVMTTDQLRQRKAQLAEQAGPFEAAKFDLLMRNFEGAKKRAEAILAESPENPDALLLMAVLNDFWCLNNPKEALKWYGILAGMEDNRAAVYAGLYGIFRMNYTLGRWEQSISAGELLLDKIPCLYGGMTSEVERFLEYARSQLNNTNKK